MTKVLTLYGFNSTHIKKKKKKTAWRKSLLSVRDRSSLYNKLGLKGYVKKIDKKIDFMHLCYVHAGV